MQVDARAVARGERITGDVCIVGAGAAGIALARELLGSGLRVVLLESGGFEPDPDTQALYAGDSVGQPYFPLDACRLRFFGGTTNHWVGYSRPLEPLDFEGRAWVPGSGWPLRAGELAPAYRRAQEVLQLGPERYDAEFWSLASGKLPLPLEGGTFDSGVFQLSPPTRFGSAYREELVRAADLQLILRANATALETTPTGEGVASARVQTLEGNRFEVLARAFVLAAGGIENARLLLASRALSHPAGLGNRHDRVGRYFLEHPHLVDAFFLPSDPAFDASFYSASRCPEGRFVGLLRLRDSVAEREDLNPVCITLEPTARRDADYLEAESSEGVVSLKYLARHLNRQRVPDGLWSHVWRVISNLDEVGTAAWGRARGGQAEGRMYKVFIRTEQTPNPESRVLLGEERDALGLPRATLDWHLLDRDLRSIQRGHELLAREVGRVGLGRLFFPPEDPDRTWIRSIFGGNHHMGTTRMHADPRHGVVDADCRVHGLANLYVAGSSVFPSAGIANPTLTIVALALRLAWQLRQRLE